MAIRFIERRRFITILGGAAAFPLAARAQQSGGMRRIGVLMALCRERPAKHGRCRGVPGGTPEARVDGGPQPPDRHSLGDATTRNCGNDSRKELVALQPDLILSQTTPTTAALLQQTRTIPIVFVRSPIRSAAASSRAFRGRAATSPVSPTIEASMAGKWLELLKEIAPRVNRVAFLFNPATATYVDYYLNPFKAAAASFARGSDRRTRSRRLGAESVIAVLAREANGGLVVMPDPFIDQSSCGGHVAGGSPPAPGHLLFPWLQLNSAAC